jgi:hypothetical protein
MSPRPWAGCPRGAVSVVESGRPLRSHPLFFDRMTLPRPESPAHQYGRRRGMPPKPPPAPAARPPSRGVQPRLFEAHRDVPRGDESTDVDLTNPWLTGAISLAYPRGEARGWRCGVRVAVRRGLTLVLSGPTAGEVVRWSELFPAMRAREIGTGRVAEVLEERGVLLEDRRAAFEDWQHRKPDGLTRGIRVDVQAWLGILHDGGPRSKPRDLAAVQNDMTHVRPFLLHCSARYDPLRDVTRDDILTVIDGLHGSHRCNVLVGLRRLFAFCRKTRVVVRDPTRGIKAAQHPDGIAQPLDQSDVDQAARTATTPLTRLVLLLAAVHAARKTALITSQLNDVDLGNRRLTLAGRTHPMDKLTHPILPEWLDHQRTRWPHTANPHLITTQQTAMGTGPVTTLGGKQELRSQAATLKRLRVDRQLKEALIPGPDPLHLAAVFALNPQTAIRYPDNTRALLVTTTQEQDPASPHEPKGRHGPESAKTPEFIVKTLRFARTLGLLGDLRLVSSRIQLSPVIV